jgi:ligand-binding sensor protein
LGHRSCRPYASRYNVGTDKHGQDARHRQCRALVNFNDLCRGMRGAKDDGTGLASEDMIVSVAAASRKKPVIFRSRNGLAKA